MGSERIAVVVTRSEDYQAAAIPLARSLGYEVIVPRNPSIHSVTRQTPDLILIDWQPSHISENTRLIQEIRASSVMRNTPVCLLHSDPHDVPQRVYSTDRVIVLEMPFPKTLFERALRRLGNDLVPQEPAPTLAGPTTPDADPRERPRKVFIGHGRSPVWKDLKTFLTERLSLECIEFNTEPPAGVPTADRLSQMLQETAFAFVVFTGEDAHVDGSLHARENAIHELGLFQGRLGLRKAIVLLEEGCQEFSNIVGVGQIRFPRGSPLARAEEIRQVLEREQML